jgi:MoaA/NifB/PqqE/SkfB family radical SAM enzyme
VIQLISLGDIKSITLGGGEPSLYPGIVGLTNHLLHTFPNLGIGVKTNGTGNIDAILGLISLAQKHVMLHVSISADKYHKPIPDVVTKAVADSDGAGVGINEASGFSPIRMGRAMFLDEAESNGCGRSNIVIAADGTVFPCPHGLSWRYDCLPTIKVTEVLMDRLAIEATTVYAPRCCRNEDEYIQWVTFGYPQTLDFLYESEPCKS